MRKTKLFAQIWWCADQECDCTEPQIVRATPREFHTPPYQGWHVEVLWRGEYLTPTHEYSLKEREDLQFAPLREQCIKYDIPVPIAASEIRKDDKP